MLSKVHRDLTFRLSYWPDGGAAREVRRSPVIRIHPLGNWSIRMISNQSVTDDLMMVLKVRISFVNSC